MPKMDEKHDSKMMRFQNYASFVEMVENLEIKKKPNPKDEELQKTFQSLLASNIKRIKERDKIKHPYHKFSFSWVNKL